MKLHNKIAHLFGYELIRKRKLGHLIAASHLEIMLRALEINCVIDAGANRGDYGALLRDIGYTGLIISFEPVNAICDGLRSRAARDEQWHVYQYALGSADERKAINVTSATGFTSFHRANAYGHRRFGNKQVDIARQEDVEVRRLDGLFETLGLSHDTSSLRIFLKMDTQGYDLEVFKGAGGVLDYVHGLQSELSVRHIYEGMPDYIDALTEFREKGFEVTGMYPVSRDHESGVVIEFDCMMRRT